MRKFLSMVLALTMTMTLMTTFAAPASANNFTDFQDLDEVTNVYYKEAIDVITAVKIMGGRNDSTFAPKDTLTRGAASKIICNMLLGPAAAEALPSSANPFKDVAAGSTYAGYIAYVSGKGIVNGYSDGTFRPAEALSGYAFLKMLLGALGYSTQTEGYTGDNWKVNVAKQAFGTTSHLTKNLADEDSFDGNQAITREEAALFAFNTLCTDMVEYGLRVGNGNNVFSSDVARSRQWQGSSGEYNNIINRAFDGNTVQFAEENFPRLVRRNNTFNGETDGFGRPRTVWTYKGVEIGTYTEIPDYTFDHGVKVNEIYNALGMTDGDSGAEMYINGYYFGNLSVAKGNDTDVKANGYARTNGYSYTDDNGTVHVNAHDGWEQFDDYAMLPYRFIDNAVNQGLDRVGNGTNTLNANSEGADAQNHPFNSYHAYADDKIGDGTIIECFLDQDYNHVTICAMSVYGGKVTALKGKNSTKDDYVIIDYAQDSVAKRPDGITGANKDEFETTDFEEDDVVWYTYSEVDNEIKSMGILEAVEGALTRRYVNKSVIIDGNTYTYAKMYTFGDNLNEDSLTNKSEYIVYLDDNGYALWIEEADVNVDDYALVETLVYEVVTGNTVNYYSRSLRNSTNGAPYYSPTGNAPTDGTLESKLSKNQAKLLFGDGRERTVDLDDAYTDQVYWPGRIVRATKNSDGDYKLQSVGVHWGATSYMNTAKNSMTLDSGRGTWTAQNGISISADAKTVFVVKDSSDRYKIKVYTGVRNVPDISSGVAFALEKSGTADVVFVTEQGDIKTSSTDVMFIAAASQSNRITSDSTRASGYRAYNAVVNGDYRTVYIDETINITAENVPAGGGILRVANDFDKQYYSLIVNDVTEDSDDVITSVRWRDNDATIHYAYGIRKYIEGEIRINTNVSVASTARRNVVVADAARIYYVDGDGNIDEMDVYDIATDSDDVIYYIEEDGEITYLWVCEYDSAKDDDPNPTRIGVGNAGGNNSSSAVRSVTGISPSTINWPVGTNFDWSQISVQYVDSFGEARSISATNDAVVHDEISTAATGTKTADVTFNDKTFVLTVNVYQPVTEPVIVDANGVEITEVNADVTAADAKQDLSSYFSLKKGTEEMKLGEDYTLVCIPEFDSSMDGTYYVTVKPVEGGTQFEEKTITITLNKTEEQQLTVKKISVAKTEYTYSKAEEGVRTKIKDDYDAAIAQAVTATMSDDVTTEELEASEYSVAPDANLVTMMANIAGTDDLVAASGTITITYTGTKLAAGAEAPSVTITVTITD